MLRQAICSKIDYIHDKQHIEIECHGKPTHTIVIRVTMVTRWSILDRHIIHLKIAHNFSCFFNVSSDRKIRRHEKQILR